MSVVIHHSEIYYPVSTFCLWGDCNLPLHAPQTKKGNILFLDMNTAAKVTRVHHVRISVGVLSYAACFI